MSKMARPTAIGKESLGTPTRLSRVLALAAALMLAAGCSDEVVCPSAISGPYFSIRIVEEIRSDGEATLVEIYCSADPLPGRLDASVNGEDLPDAVPVPGQSALMVTTERDSVLWEPGAICTLAAETEYGVATSKERVPGTFEVSAPDTVSLGQPLVLDWTQSSDATYYILHATLTGAARDTIEFMETSDTTGITIDAGDIPLAGNLVGHVAAVSGPLPAVGAEGNVSGIGWGFFTISYRDTADAFEVTVRDTLMPRARAH